MFRFLDKTETQRKKSSVRDKGKLKLLGVNQGPTLDTISGLFF